MVKHAFLIMAHTQPGLLKRLVKRLDNDRIDIYLHIDKKSSIADKEIEGVVQRSGISFSKRTNVAWGGIVQYLLNGSYYN